MAEKWLRTDIWQDNTGKRTTSHKDGVTYATEMLTSEKTQNQTVLNKPKHHPWKKSKLFDWNKIIKLLEEMKTEKLPTSPKLYLKSVHNT